MRTNTTQFDVVLFDLGGVLVELPSLQTLLTSTHIPNGAEAVQQYWLTSPIVQTFETGKSEPEQFADALISELALPVDRSTFLEAFTRWPKGLFPGALDLIKALPTHMIRATLSNTNILHWPRLMNEMGLADLFDYHFPSHLTENVKPDKKAFEAVLKKMDLYPDTVLFLDDNQLNVDTANALGIQAYLVHGVEETREVLELTRILT